VKNRAEKQEEISKNTTKFLHIFLHSNLKVFCEGVKTNNEAK
jgi:hypothetical protein